MKKRLLLAILAVVFTLSVTSMPAQAQGCSQCRETIGQTPVQTQRAYRKAILVLVLAAGGIFTAGVVAVRRYR